MLIVLSLGAAEGTTMDDKIQQKIAEAARAEYGWKVEEVRTDEVERLRRSSCSFSTAANAVRPLSYQANYAVLPGDEVIGISDPDAAGKILDTCSAGARADWWAEIITRFHGDLSGGIVLADEQVRPDITRKLIQAGMKFTPPAFSDDKQSVSFLLLQPETYILYRVQATRSAGGPIQVVTTKLLLNATTAKPTSQLSPGDAMNSIREMLR